jgi:F-type H+-transporting ATPase subunit alpha
MKQVAGTIKLDLAQFREMEAFAQFASDLDASTQKLLARGTRLTELLKQPQFSPLSMAEQVCSIFAGVNGYLDDVAVRDVNAYEAQMLAALRAHGSEILKTIATEQKISDETKASLQKFLEDFTKTFVSGKKAA